MKLDLLAIAAHPDDVELTCGGTLLKAHEQGYKTGILDLTAGEMGTRGDPETRLRESRRAGKILCVTHRENLRLPDAHLELNQKYKFAVAERIRTLKPHVVILPYWEGRHPDHYVAAQLGYEGCFLAGLKKLPIAGEAFRPFKLLYSTVYYKQVQPTFVVDITRHFDRRYKAILSYHSQFRPKAKDRKSKVDIPLDRLHQEVNLIARYFGNLAGVEYGEPFVVKEVMGVDDVMKLSVRSI
jgi:bacillithiol biosynthesis deacetylase BshB1